MLHVLDKPHDLWHKSLMPTPILLHLPSDCLCARFLRREKRFTVYATTLDGKQSLLAHTNNTGSMLGLLRPGSEVLLSPAANPARKLPFTLELAWQNIFLERGFWAGVNTSTPNRMLQAAWKAGALPELADCTTFKREAVYGASRLDALLTGPAGDVWVECKNVTLVEDDVALFPDAATERGRKHLVELAGLARQGVRTALFFLVQRSDAKCFAPASLIDPEYARLFYDALDAGVEAWPWMTHISPAGIGLERRLPVLPRG